MYAHLLLLGVREGVLGRVLTRDVEAERPSFLAVRLMGVLFPPARCLAAAFPAALPGNFFFTAPPPVEVIFAFFGATAVFSGNVGGIDSIIPVLGRAVGFKSAARWYARDASLRGVVGGTIFCTMPA